MSSFSIKLYCVFPVHSHWEYRVHSIQYTVSIYIFHITLIVYVWKPNLKILFFRVNQAKNSKWSSPLQIIIQKENEKERTEKLHNKIWIISRYFCARSVIKKNCWWATKALGNSIRNIEALLFLMAKNIIFL